MKQIPEVSAYDRYLEYWDFVQARALITFRHRRPAHTSPPSKEWRQFIANRYLFDPENGTIEDCVARFEDLSEEMVHDWHKWMV